MSLNEYLTAGNSKSSMRLGFIWSVITGCVGGFILAVLDIILNHGANLLGVAAVVGAWQLFAFGGKAYSGKWEQRREGGPNADIPRP